MRPTCDARWVDLYAKAHRRRSTLAPVDYLKGEFDSFLDGHREDAAFSRPGAEVRDYLDIDSLLTQSNISLANMLAATAIIYGDQFNPLLSLKAVSYHEDANLTGLPMTIRNRLSEAVQNTDPAKLPSLSAVKLRGGQP